MKAPPRTFSGGIGRPFNAVLISSRCRVRIKEVSEKRPDALVLSSNAHLVARNGIVVAMTPMERTVFLLLAARRGALVDYATLEDAIWGDDPDGGADATREAIRTVVSRLRPAAMLLGLAIRSHMRLGLYASDLFASHQQVAA